MMREFVLCVPLILLFPNWFEPAVKGPLYSAPVADVMTIIVAVVMMIGVVKKLQKKELETQKVEETLATTDCE